MQVAQSRLLWKTLGEDYFLKLRLRIRIARSWSYKPVTYFLPQTESHLDVASVIGLSKTFDTGKRNPNISLTGPSYM